MIKKIFQHHALPWNVFLFLMGTPFKSGNNSLVQDSLINPLDINILNAFYGKPTPYQCFLRLSKVNKSGLQLHIFFSCYNASESIYF